MGDKKIKTKEGKEMRRKLDASHVFFRIFFKILNLIFIDKFIVFIYFLQYISKGKNVEIKENTLYIYKQQPFYK